MEKECSSYKYKLNEIDKRSANPNVNADVNAYVDILAGSKALSKSISEQKH
jgi:hypothetical protein